MTRLAWLGLWAATLTAAATGTAALADPEVPSVVTLESLRTLEAVAMKPLRWLRQAKAVDIPGREYIISGSGSGDRGSETVVAPTSGSSSGSSSETIAIINSRVPDDVLGELVQDVLEAAAAEAENRDAHSEASSKADGSASASASSSRDDAAVTFPPATAAPTPTPSSTPPPTPSPTPSPTPTPSPSQDDSSSDKAFKLRVILIGVAGGLVVLVMATLVAIAWIRNPGRRRRSTSASIESLVLSPLDNNGQAALATSSANNSNHSYIII